MTDGCNGAQALLAAAERAGASVCFANPGTTELVLVRALEATPGIRPVLGLFEGVCTGAADGYARVSGRPALTLLHLGPGFANGVANLHNARRAHSPIVNVIGDHATWHLQYDAPLTSDIESLAGPVSSAIIRLAASATVEHDVRRAFSQALSSPGSVVTLIAPTDVMEGAAPEVAAGAVAAAEPRPVPPARIADCARALGAAGPVILLLGAGGLAVRSQRAAARIASACGARLLMEAYPPIVELGGDLPRLERLAYFPDDVLRQLDGARVVLAGARAPVSYFGYEGQPSELADPNRLVTLATPEEDCAEALERLADSLGACQALAAPAPPAVPAPSPAFAPGDVVEALIAEMPEDAIVSLEGSTLGGPFLQRAFRARRHRVMTNTGGAIGQGLPCAVGAAVARPDARVIALQSDGSAQYTVQSLWTMAREQLPITIVVAANHRYGILQTELRRGGADLESPVLDRLTRLDTPRVDWVAIAHGYGVPAVRATEAEGFRAALRRGLATPGPFLIQTELP
jgi:acetolactate synthase-1/2/3 large subunit